MLSLHVVTSAVTDRLTGKKKYLFFPNKLISEENSDSWKKENLNYHRFERKQ